MTLADRSIHRWIQENKIKNEKGDLITFENHLYLYDIYRDQAQNLVVMKAAQVGLTTLEILKTHFDAKRLRMDIIYTLPTDKDAQVFVSGKVNRIIANNPCMLADVADKDSVEQKQVGNSMVYFRGTHTKKAAIMVTADRLVHDEKDSSKLEIVAEYQARLQASKFKQTHTFSHPSLPETGVHADWLQSDQKHWFIKCEHCAHWQYLSWDMDDPQKMSIDLELKAYVCKKCHGVLSDETRATGQWVAKRKGKEWSGYWVSLLMNPLVSAEWIINKFHHPDTTLEFFMQKIIGLPYADGNAKLLESHFKRTLTGRSYAPGPNDMVVIGVDTGNKIDYVMGNRKGLFFQGECRSDITPTPDGKQPDPYDELDEHMDRWKKAIAIVDQGGDLIGARRFAARWPGRVFLCSLGGDRKTKQLVKWGEGDEYGAVSCDRNRMVSIVVGEFREQRIKTHGTWEEWKEYMRDWSHLSRRKILDPDTAVVKGHEWVRAGRDHRAMATVFWRVGMQRFESGGFITTPSEGAKPNSYFMNPDGTASFDPAQLLGEPQYNENEDDWRLT